MLTAPNLHQFAHEDKARRARHAEIDVRYAWLARQSGAWPAGESRKYPRGSPQLLCRIRLRELEALYGARYGGTLPYDDAGIDDLKIAAHHIGHRGAMRSATSLPGRICGCLISRVNGPKRSPATSLTI